MLRREKLKSSYHKQSRHIWYLNRKKIQYPKFNRYNKNLILGLNHSLTGHFQNSHWARRCVRHAHVWMRHGFPLQELDTAWEWSCYNGRQKMKTHWKKTPWALTEVTCLKGTWIGRWGLEERHSEKAVRCDHASDVRKHCWRAAVCAPSLEALVQQAWGETQESLFLVNIPGDSDAGIAQITFWETLIWRAKALFLENSTQIHS